MGERGDIVVVGAGLSGSLAALLLGRAGWRVLVVDRSSQVPTQFRCEKLAAAHLDILRRHGLLDAVEGAGARYRTVLVAREGRALGIRRIDEIGLRYGDFVSTIRGLWPSTVSFVEGHVDAIEPGRDRQRVRLRDGRVLDGRLTFLATGASESITRSLGVVRTASPLTATLSVGFDLECEGGALPHQSLTYFGERPGNNVAYATLFPFRDTVRANVFSFPDDPTIDVAAYRHDPLGFTIAQGPGLAALLPAIRRVGQPQFHVSPQHRAVPPACDGIVLIGEALRSTCPATGSGALCALTDVDRRPTCAEGEPLWHCTATSMDDRVDSRSGWLHHPRIGRESSYR